MFKCMISTSLFDIRENSAYQNMVYYMDNAAGKEEIKRRSQNGGHMVNSRFNDTVGAVEDGCNDLSLSNIGI